LNNGKIKCWGDGTNGALGWDSTEDTVMEGGVSFQGDALPYVLLASEATAVSAGEHFSCAILVPGRVQCWGAGKYHSNGRTAEVDIGSSSTVAGSSMARIRDVDVLNNYGLVVQIASSRYATVALMDTGVLLGWGSWMDLGGTVDIYPPRVFTLVDCAGKPTIGPTLRPQSDSPTPIPPTNQPTQSRSPTSKPTSTKKPTTLAPAKLATSHPTTKHPTTAHPTTKHPTTKKPTTKHPTTKKPTTAHPTTKKPTTKKPTTKKPTT